MPKLASNQVSGSIKSDEAKHKDVGHDENTQNLASGTRVYLNSVHSELLDMLPLRTFVEEAHKREFAFNPTDIKLSKVIDHISKLRSGQMDCLDFAYRGIIDYSIGWYDLLDE